VVHVREPVVHVWEPEGLRVLLLDMHVRELERLLRTRTRQVHIMRELEVLVRMLEHLLRTSTRQEPEHLLRTSTQQELGHLLRT
jgi:hypothetical protein